MGAQHHEAVAENADDENYLRPTMQTSIGPVTKITEQTLLNTIRDLRKSGDAVQKRAARAMQRYYKNRTGRDFYYITNNPDRPMCDGKLYEAAAEASPFNE